MNDHIDIYSYHSLTSFENWCWRRFKYIFSFIILL